ncbi:hypothetical protein V6N13_053110 [Hibiscus sabdariffa]
MPRTSVILLHSSLSSARFAPFPRPSSQFNKANHIDVVVDENANPNVHSPTPTHSPAPVSVQADPLVPCVMVTMPKDSGESLPTAILCRDVKLCGRTSVLSRLLFMNHGFSWATLMPLFMPLNVRAVLMWFVLAVIFKAFYLNVAFGIWVIKALTWSRGAPLARLDRMLCNTYWDESFPESAVSHLFRMHFDHQPLLLYIGPPPGPPPPRQFRYSSGWLSHVDFQRMI